MTIKRGFFFRGVFLVIVFCIGTSIGQDLCNSYTFIKVPGASPLNQTEIIGNASEAYCQSSCFNQNNCYGYTWLSGICYLNLNPSINYTAPNATYYSLIRSLPNCNQTSPCSYYWNGIKDTHGFGGVQQDNINNLNDCVTSCQQTASCASLDWDTQKGECWILSPNAPTGPASGVYHFAKNCQPLTTVPTTASTTTTTTATATTIANPTTTSGTLPGTPTMPTVSTTQSAPSSSMSSSPSSTASSVVSTSSTTTTTQAPLCNGIKCGLGEVCGSDNATCVCANVTLCSQDYMYVCGSDNKTYNNECELHIASCNANRTIDLDPLGNCHSAPGPYQSTDDDSEFASYPMAIKPAYIVLAGLGGGCLLLVLTAVIILCEYPLHGAETYSSSGTLVKGTHGQDIHMSSAVVVEDGEGGGGGEENVEFNPYYNRSELGAPDFTKEENIM